MYDDRPEDQPPASGIGSPALRRSQRKAPRSKNTAAPVMRRVGPAGEPVRNVTSSERGG